VVRLDATVTEIDEDLALSRIVAPTTKDASSRVCFPAVIDGSGELQGKPVDVAGGTHEAPVSSTRFPSMYKANLIAARSEAFAAC
jgi:hypothetical protein